MAQLSWKPAVVLCIAPSLMNAPFALVFARLSHAKTWLHIQDFELDAALRLGLLPESRGLAGLATRFERALLNSFDHLSTISDKMLARLHKIGLPQHKTNLFPNWVDVNQIHPLLDENPLRTTLGLSPDQLVVLYAGSMGRKQGLEHLLAAARHLQREQPQVQFILCGEGVLRAELESTARDLSNVRFLPVQPLEKLNQLLNIADVHVLLQKADAADLVMPSKLSGMLASGKAVIATANLDTEVGQVVAQVGLLVPQEDSMALAEAILQLANSPTRRVKLGRLGREYAVTHWDAALVLSQFEQQLSSLTQTAK